MPFLDQRLQPVPPVEDKHLARLIADLDSPTFAARDKATQELEDLAEIATAPCRLALGSGPSLEVRGRLERVLATHKAALAESASANSARLARLGSSRKAGNAAARAVLVRLGRQNAGRW